MAFESGTDRLVCTACGVAHEAKWERLPVRENQIVRCRACAATMVSGRLNRDYAAVRIVAG